MPEPENNLISTGLLARLKRRGVLRVAFSYAVIAWLVLQIGDVVLDPFETGAAVMKVLLVVVALGFPVALALAWFFELTPQGVEVDHAGPGAPRPAVVGIRRYADIVIIGVLVVAVAFLLARQGGLIEEGAGEQVVAVLPFENLSPEAADAYFGEGLADTLIHKLGQLGELVVLASQSTFQFTGRDLDLGEVGAKLGATVIMLGSVQRAGKALRVNARLVEVDSGKQLWSGSYDSGVQDVFAIQDEIASSVTDALHLVLGPEAEERLTTPATTNLTAYDAYVLGISRLAARTSEDRKQALSYFRQAIAADADYALAYTGLVEALHLEANTYRPDEGLAAILSEASDAARRALELDSGLGEAWLARALVAAIEYDFLDHQAMPEQDIIALFEKAIELSPNNAMAHKYFSNFYINSLGDRTSKPRDLMIKAAQLDPRSGIIKLNIGNGYEADGRYALAEEWYRQAVRTQEPYFRLALVQLVALHLMRTGRLDEAARWARAFRRVGPDDPFAPVFEQDAFMNLGAWAEARAALEDLANLAAENMHMTLNVARWGELNQGLLMARRSGNWETVGHLARLLSAEFWELDRDWPVLQGTGWHSQGMTTLALSEIQGGEAASALARFEAAYPGPFEDISTQFNDILCPVFMLAALYKLNGETETAERVLRDYLAFLTEPEAPSTRQPTEWAMFTIHALLGDTESALAELERVVNTGHLYQWWSLKEGAFDPDYAAVLADPRFEELYGRITARVDELREAYFSNPDLPEGYLP